MDDDTNQLPLYQRNGLNNLREIGGNIAALHGEIINLQKCVIAQGLLAANAGHKVELSKIVTDTEILHSKLTKEPF
jgi:hypothetical protein